MKASIEVGIALSRGFLEYRFFMLDVDYFSPIRSELHPSCISGPTTRAAAAGDVIEPGVAGTL